MSGIELLALGHSHLGAVQQAYVASNRDVPPRKQKARFIRLSSKVFQPNFVVVNGRNELEPALKRRLRSLLRNLDPKAVLLSALGNGHHALSLLQHPKPFDFYWPEMNFDDTGLDRASEIPFDLMMAQVRDNADNGPLVFWREINANAKCPILLLLPPPPVKDDAHIRSHPGNFREKVQRYGISPASLRLKVYMLYIKVLQDAVKGTDTTIVEAPYKALSDGFLAEPYWAHDPTHANTAYGALILDELRKKAGVEI